MSNKYSVLSLFSGCGGLDKGFEGGFNFLGTRYPSHPFKIVFCNDLMPNACETIKLNFKTPHVECGDIKEIIDNRPEIFPRADVVTGGFPCQDFSLAGKRLGFKSERGKLYLRMKEVIEIVKPKIFIAENVKGLTNLGEALQKISEDFANSNPKYEVDSKLHMAANFGVPQRRDRVFIVGVREDIARNMEKRNRKYEFPFPKHTHSAINGEIPFWITAKEAIEDLEKENKNLDRQDQYSKARNYGSHLQGNKSISPNEIAPTIRAEHHGNIEFHYKGHRRLTVRECARIQSFPDDFRFFGSASSVYVQIGNAVPPVLAWHMAKSTKEFLDKYG